MTTMMRIRKGRRQLTFENLRGLRAEGYIRDSSRDQRDGFGPEMQRKAIENFASTYGLILGGAWYTDFITGTSTLKRSGFLQFVEDAELDRFDVLLVYHTSRFARNRADAIKYKAELRRLGKTVVFVSQGIISGNDNDFLNEGINEVLDEQYSRNISLFVSDGLARKAEHGLHVGPAPLGYKSELLSGKPERKVPDPQTMPALLMLLREYASGRHSFREVADHLNARGFRTHSGSLFTGYSIRDILANRFYEGKVVYHRGLPDERVIEGCHEVSDEIREMWLHCQDIKKGRTVRTAGRPRNEKHDYPFSRVLRCHRCGNLYHGEAVYYHSRTNLRLTHERRGPGRQCDAWPRSRSVESLCQEFSDRVLAHVCLDGSWRKLIVAALRVELQVNGIQEQQDRITRALENLRKQHLWGDISDDDYRRERTVLERQLKIATPDSGPTHLPNLERAAQLLNDLPALWSHPGVTNEQREALAQEVFSKVTIDGTSLVAIEPKPAYLPLFAAKLIQNPVGYCEMGPPPSPPA